jgi:hypothetical protein
VTSGASHAPAMGRERSFVRSGRRFDPRPALRAKTRLLGEWEGEANLSSGLGASVLNPTTASSVSSSSIRSVFERLQPARGNSESMFAFPFAVIHSPRHIKISAGMNDTMASPRGASSIKTPGRTSVFFAVWGRNPRYCQRAAMPPRDSSISSA